jgi:predicted GIY-YIG superfamily endonuclease
LEKPWLVYILKCSDGSYYTGITNDLSKRVEKHNTGKGAKYTRARTPVIVMYARLIGTMVDAMREERRIKKLTRKQKEKLFT